MLKSIKNAVMLALCAALGLGTLSAQAADTNTLTVTASVTGTCKFVSATSTLAFGALDPSSAADGTATGSAQYWCTKGAAATVTAGNGDNFSGSRRLKHASLAEFIPYALTMPSGATGTGDGPANPITLSLAGTITNANYINASAGNYSDTVVLTVNP